MDRDQISAANAKVTEAGKKQSKASSWAQEEQARQTAELDAAIDANDAKELLSTLYGLWPWDEAPNRAAELEPQKSAIIKELLTELKSMDSSDGYISLASELDMLAALGVRWPELGLIRRGMEEEDRRRSQQGMWESIKINDPLDGHKVYNMISQGLMEEVVSMLDHRNYKYGDDPSIDRVFDQKINLVQKWMERMLDISIADGSYAWRMIKDMELPWDSVDSWWTDHKTETVRRLLKLLKEDRYEDVLGIIEDILDDLGLAWPELDVIRRSAQAELERADQNAELDESDDDEESIVRMSSPDERIVDDMFRRMREGSWMALEDAISELEERRMPDHMILDALSPQADSIARWLDSRIKEGSHNNRMLGQIWKLLEISARWPSLARLVNKHKAMIVRDMLTQIKAADSMDLEDLEGHLRQLYELGMTWPEMDVISRSVNAELDRIYNIDESGDMLGYRISKGDLIDGMQNSLRAGHNGAWGNNYAHMRPWSRKHTVKQLTRIKPDIIAWINKYLSSAKNTDWRYGKLAILDLDRLGVYWPELWKVVDNNRKAWVHDWLIILRSLMGNDYPEELEDLESHIRSWQKTFEQHGLKWPEIETILASIRGETDTLGHLNESSLAKAAVEEAKQMLWSQLPDGNWWTVGRALDNMIYAKVPMNEIFEVLDEYKRDILTQQNRLTQGENSEVLAGVSNLRRLRDIGAGWPEIDQMLTRNKRHIMRAALTEIKGYSTEDYGDELPHIYKNLKKLKVAWPEMAVIADGIDSIQQLGEDQMPNSEKLKVMAEIAADVDMLKQISVRLDYYRELLDKLDALRKSGNDWPELRQFEKTIRRQMKQRYDKIQQELASAHPHAVTDAYIDVEDLLGKAAAKDWLYDNRQAIAHALDRNLAHDGYMRATDILLKRLVGWGAKWPEILSVFAKNKEHLIRDMLVDIKQRNANPNDITHLQDRVALFKEFVPDWPELDIINKSINAQKIGEDWHDVDTEDYDEVYGRMGSALQDIENGLRTHMDDWHAEVVVNGLADLAQLLDNHDWLDTPTPSEYSLDLVKQKPLFVKALLIGMKHSDTDNVLDAIRMLEDYWHVRWPELDIMHKSMRAGKVNESVPSHDEEAYRYAEDTAATLPEEADDPDSCMYVFLTAADHPEVIGPWAAEYFLPHKDTWIRWLLAQMKGDEYDTDEIWEAVNMLQRMQLPWPELDIIKRSIEGDFRG